MDRKNNSGVKPPIISPLKKREFTAECLKEAIDKRLGRTDWTLEEVKGRLSKYITPDKAEMITFDGKDLLLLYNINYYIKDDGNTIKLNFTQKYKIIAKNP